MVKIGIRLTIAKINERKQKNFSESAVSKRKRQGKVCRFFCNFNRYAILSTAKIYIKRYIAGISLFKKKIQANTDCLSRKNSLNQREENSEGIHRPLSPNSYAICAIVCNLFFGFGECHKEKSVCCKKTLTDLPSQLNKFHNVQFKNISNASWLRILYKFGFGRKNCPEGRISTFIHL